MIDYIALIDKYYAQRPELKQVLLVHSMQVRDKAMQIVANHPDWITQQLVDPVFIEEAAMLHDIGIIYCNAPRIHCHGEYHYILHGYLGAELLRKEGLNKHADVAERHTGSGISEEQVIREGRDIPIKDYCPRTLEEKIICYADKFYSKSHLGEEVKMEKVRQNIWRYGHDAVLRFDEMRQLMGE